MVLIVMSAAAISGKRKEAIEHLKKLVEYRKKKFGDDTESLAHLTPAPGMNNRLMVSARYASLAAWEQTREKKHADKEWMALVQKGWNFLDQSSISRTIFKVL